MSPFLLPSRRDCGSSSRADEDLAERDAAVVGRHLPVAQHGEAASASCCTRADEQQRVVEHAAGRARPCRGRSRSRHALGQVERPARPRPAWNRAATSAGRRPARTSSDDRARPRAASATDRRRGRRAGRTRYAAGASRRRGRRLQLDRRLGLVVDDVPHAGQRGDRVEEPAHARGRHAAQPGLSWWASTRRSPARAGGAPRAGPASSATPAARRCASAIR